jgi:hypothetical protein
MIRMVLYLFALAFVFISACVSPGPTSQKSKRFVHTTNDSIRYSGRIKEGDSVAIYWSATSITFRFKGTSANALLKDERGLNYFNVVIDGDSLHFIRLNAEKQFYTLAEDLPNGEHTISLIKRNEWDKGTTYFYGIEIDGELLAPPPQKKRVIEFFGDSITAGYAIEDNTGGDSPDSIFTNNYYTYAALTARHFNADYYCTVKSGIGIMISWFPLIMPEMYDRLDPNDPRSRWDFKKVQPDVVVINLLQNDSWLVNKPEHESFKKRFGTSAPGKEQIISSYRTFIQRIRTVYPNAHLICALGSMDATKAGSPWPQYVKQAVTSLSDSKIHTLFFPYMNKGGHPRRADNEKMAGILIDFITKEIRW